MVTAATDGRGWAAPPADAGACGKMVAGTATRETEMPDANQASRYAGLGIAGLAAATHVAEDTGDDMRFLDIQAEVERRTPAEQEAFRIEYIGQMRGRAAMRG